MPRKFQPASELLMYTAALDSELFDSLYANYKDAADAAIVVYIRLVMYVIKTGHHDDCMVCSPKDEPYTIDTIHKLLVRTHDRSTVRNAIQALSDPDVGLIDISDDGCLIVHFEPVFDYTSYMDFVGRKRQLNAERQRRYREQKNMADSRSNALQVENNASLVENNASLVENNALKVGCNAYKEIKEKKGGGGTKCVSTDNTSEDHHHHPEYDGSRAAVHACAVRYFTTNCQDATPDQIQEQAKEFTAFNEGAFPTNERQLTKALKNWVKHAKPGELSPMPDQSDALELDANDPNLYA